jgi:hypothetical protein
MIDSYREENHPVSSRPESSQLRGYFRSQSKDLDVTAIFRDWLSSAFLGNYSPDENNQ